MHDLRTGNNMVCALNWYAKQSALYATRECNSMDRMGYTHDLYKPARIPAGHSSTPRIARAKGKQTGMWMCKPRTRTRTRSMMSTRTIVIGRTRCQGVPQRIIPQPLNVHHRSTVSRVETIPCMCQCTIASRSPLLSEPGVGAWSLGSRLALRCRLPLCLTHVGWLP